MTKEICGNCKYRRKQRGESDWYCANPESDAYMCETGFGDGCMDFEGRLA